MSFLGRLTRHQERYDPLPEVSFIHLENLFKARGWEIGHNPQPHLNFTCKHPEHGVAFIGHHTGELSYVPLDSLASTAARFSTPSILISRGSPKPAILEQMMQRNCYMLRHDEISLLPGVLRMLDLEKRRQQSVIEAANAHSASGPKDGDLVFSPQSVVRQIWRALLGREASADDQDLYAPVVSRGSLEEGIQKFAQLVAGSAEFRGRMAQGAAEKVIDRVPAPDRSEFAMTLSFGTHCAMAKLLQRDGLKKVSTPFDWIFSSARMIEHAVVDDFKTFLDPEQHQSIEPHGKESRAEHLYYKKHFGIDSLFNHRDPNLGDGLAYYQRGVQRLQRLIEDSSPFLGVMMTQDWRTSEKDARSLCRTLQERAPFLTFVCVRTHSYDRKHPRFGFNLVDQVGSNCIIDYHAVGNLGPLSWDTEIDTLSLMMLIRRIRTAGPRFVESEVIQHFAKTG